MRINPINLNPRYNKHLSFCARADENFETLAQAQKFFQKEYGIEANFPCLKAAYALKDAIDEFSKFDYKGGCQKLFEGLRIVSKPLPNKNTIANIHSKFSIKLSKDMYNLIQGKIKAGSDPYSTLEEHIQNPSYIVNSVIYLNADYDWDNIEKTLIKKYNLGYHPFETPKGAMCHELAHYLHDRCAPGFINKIKNKTFDQNIQQKVSTYATKDGYEFVAEYVAGRMEGNIYPPDVDRLYKELKGPDLFERLNL